MDSSEIRISFCIPIYNAAAYIQTSIESIMRQQVDGYEIVCVDDCSTDPSYEILTRMQSVCPQLVVLRNERNMGVSYTRNAAVQAARGVYVWMADADDQLADNIANIFYRFGIEHHADAVLGKCCTFYENTVPPEIRQGEGHFTKADFADPVTYYQRDQNGLLSYGLWLGIFRRAFLEENKLSFRKGLNLLEDVTFYFEVGMKAENVYLSDLYSYFYRIRRGSISHYGGDLLRKKYFETCLRVMGIFSEYLDREGDGRYGRSIQAHLNERKGTAMYYLLHVADRHYVAGGLKKMKELGWYPYRYDASLDYRKRTGKEQFVIYRIIPHEPLFWAFYYTLLLRRKLLGKPG